MVAIPKKYKNALSFSKVSSLAGFIKWTNKIKDEHILFRGLANAEWGGESSLYRQLKDESKNVDSGIFLKKIEASIKNAHNNKKNIKYNKESGLKIKLNDLELLADLQHKKEANTCLVDFTTLSFVALYFACLKSTNYKTGKVIAFSSDNSDYNKVLKNTEKNIRFWFTECERNKNPCIFSPPQELNNRIISQQSVFVFGALNLSIEKFHTCEIINKKKILEELKKNGISKKMLFHDFPISSIQNPDDKKYKNRNTSSDIKDYDKAIVSNPQDSVAYNKRGIVKGKLGKFQDAISDFDEAIMLNPKFHKAYNNRGIAKRNLGKFQDAISDYDEAIRLNPKGWGAYNNRGLTKRNLNKFQDAISDYDEAIRLNPKFYQAYTNRGIAKNNLGQFQDAISDCNKAIRLNPESYEAYNNRGLTKNNCGKFQDAISDYDEAIRLNPKSYEAYNNRGLAKDNLGKLQDAISDYNESIRLHPQYSVAYNNRGIAKKNLGEFQDAISDYNKSIKLNSKYWEAYANRGNAKMKSGDIKGAKADFTKAKELNPEFELPDLPPDNSSK